MVIGTKYEIELSIEVKVGSEITLGQKFLTRYPGQWIECLCRRINVGSRTSDDLVLQISSPRVKSLRKIQLNFRTSENPTPGITPTPMRSQHNRCRGNGCDVSYRRSNDSEKPAASISPPSITPFKKKNITSIYTMGYFRIHLHTPHTKYVFKNFYPIIE